MKRMRSNENIMDVIGRALADEEIDLFSPIPLADCKITRKYLLDRAGISTEDGTAVMLAVPYYVCDDTERNISLYAVSRDYHIYYKELFSRIIPRLREEAEGYSFEGFADHSPIAEADAAARAGLGVIGKNGLLITEKYSSLVFLGEIVTSATIDCKAGERLSCEECGACIKACPARGDMSRCLSAVTQKKGVLTDEEREYILENGSAWGCDACQLACPHTKRAVKNGSLAKAEFFYRDRTPHLTQDILSGMSDEEFSCRAYSWRGRDVIMRNLMLFDGGGKDESR